MIKSAIHHIPKSAYAYAYNEDTLHIRIRTMKNDITKIDLIHGDPYEFHNPTLDPKDPTQNQWALTSSSVWNYEKTPMRKYGSSQLYDYWFVEIQPPYKRMRYGFSLFDSEQTIIFTEKGYFNEIPVDDVAYYFNFPYMNQSDLFQPPTWVKNTVWYQIFPDRFANGNKNNDPMGTLPWNSTSPTTTNFFGGDLAGVLEKLDYLVQLGITGIYFTPIFKAFSNHKYDTIDYLELDPQFGTEEELKALINACHNKGIKVMLDAVFNHCGYYAREFQDVLKNGPLSPYKDWFHIHEFPLKEEPRPNYETFAFVPSMPKLNTDHPEVKEHLIEVGKYWVREFNIDGWRLDVANEVDHHFWRSFRAAVKEINPEVFILGEIWHDSTPWLLGDQFDSVMNYPFTYGALQCIAKDKITGNQFQEMITDVLNLYPQNITEVIFNLLDSHDTARILTVCGDDKEKVKQLYTLQLTFSGTPCLYYGDEIGLTGENDPGCRGCMEWEESKQDKDLFKHIQDLLKLRKDFPELANDSSLEFIYSKDENLIQYIRKGLHNTFIISLNPSPTPLKTTILQPGVVIFGNGTLENSNILTLPARGYSIIKVDK